MKKDLIIVYTVIFIGMLGFGLAMPILPLFTEEIGGNIFLIGILASLFPIGQLISAPILGKLSDKVGRKLILLFSALGTTISFALMATTSSITILIIARLIDGLSAGTFPVSQAYVSDLSKKENNAKNLSGIQVSSALGLVLGPVLGSIFFRDSYRLIFWLATIAALIASLFVLFLKNQNPSIKDKEQPQIIKLDKKIFIYFLYYSIFVGCFTIFQTYFSVFGEHSNSLHLNPTQIMLGFLTFGISATFVPFILKKIERMGEEKILGIAIFMMALAFCLFSLEDLTICFITIIIISWSYNIFTSIIFSLMTGNNKENGKVMGFKEIPANIGRIIFPVLGSFLFDLNIKLPFIAAGFILFLLIPFFFYYQKTNSFCN